MKTATATQKKITLATVKSFIKKNRSLLEIKVRGSFDGMTDGMDFRSGAEFNPALDADRECSNNLGIQGAWFVHGSRNFFESYESETHIGISVSNCCSYFTLAVRK